MLRVSRDRCLFLVGMETLRELNEMNKRLEEAQKEFETLVNLHRETEEEPTVPEGSDTDEELLPTVTLGKLLLNSSFPTLKELIGKYKYNPEEVSLEEIRSYWANVRLQIKVCKMRFEELAAKDAARKSKTSQL